MSTLILENDELTDLQAGKSSATLQQTGTDFVLQFSGG